MTTVTIHKAKSILSKLVAQVQAGDEIVVFRGHEPVAMLVPYRKKVARRPKVGEITSKPVKLEPGCFGPLAVGQSQSLSGAKAGAISRLAAVASEYASDEIDSVDRRAISLAESFLRALPDSVPLPEFSVEPGGSISLDWIESRNRLFSLSIGTSNRFAFAWLDGTSKGHGVENFEGQQIPQRLIDGITTILRNGNASIRIA